MIQEQAYEDSLKYLAQRLKEAEFNLAVTIGTITAKDQIIKEKDEIISELIVTQKKLEELIKENEQKALQETPIE